MEQQHGILVLNKPKGLSSAQCLSRIKRLGQKKIGHAGTLDPMATGVLVLCTGKATKKIESFQYQTKEYIADLFLGATTPSFDT
ncbi:MAG: tRNA pseudouridine(55) synthase, partial [Mailhella sp.]|nr:tRNA pseudouridine(55) synthase [Mailhella sp.]